jgi:multimeric flavodoxin WrbA
MRVLAINASPNREGATASLIDLFLKECTKLGAICERLNIEDYSIYGCQECGNCSKHIECELDDDFTQLKAKMLEADAVVIGSPYYSGEAVNSLKTLMQRLAYTAFFKKDFIGKYMVGVSTSAVDDSAKIAKYCANLGMKASMGGFIVSGILCDNMVLEETIKDIEEDNQIHQKTRQKAKELIENIENNYRPEQFERNNLLFNKIVNLGIIRTQRGYDKVSEGTIEFLTNKGIIKESKRLRE